MRSMIFVLPLCLAICVSTSFAQEESKEDFTKVAKMLHGDWEGDAEKTAEELEKSDIELPEGMEEMIIEQLGQIKISFGDGEFEVDLGPMQMEGEWKVTKAEKKDDKQVLTIHVDPAEDEAKNFEIHFMGKTHMKMIDLDDTSGPAIVLKRKEKEDDKEDDG